MSRNKGSLKADRKRTDREKLELFILKVNDLHSTRLAKMGFRIQHKIQYRPESTESNLNQPDEPDIREYLLTFRPFISESEDVFLNRILNICSWQLKSDEMKQNVAHIRESLERVKQYNGILFQRNGRHITPLQATNMYLDGIYFHDDLEYQKQLVSMYSLEADFLRSYFLNFVIDTSKIIDIIQNGIYHAFQEGLFQFEGADQASLST